LFLKIIEDILEKMENVKESKIKLHFATCNTSIVNDTYKLNIFSSE